MESQQPTPEPLPWRGACRCQQLQMRLVSAPVLSAICHCRGCQRMSSSAFALTLTFASHGLEITRGDPVPGGMRSDDLQHNFCDACKSWAFTRVPQFGLVNVRATLLDDARWFVPYLETYRSTKLPWVEAPAKESYAEFPDPNDFPAVLERYTDWARRRDWPT